MGCLFPGQAQGAFGVGFGHGVALAAVAAEHGDIMAAAADELDDGPVNVLHVVEHGQVGGFFGSLIALGKGRLPVIV